MLDKDVAKRYQSARELVADLERVASGARPAEAGRRWSPSKVVLLGLSVALITAFVWAILTRAAQSGRGTLTLTPFTFYPGYEQNPAISPDGKHIAYVGQGIRGTNPLELYVQGIGSIDPVRLMHNSPGDENRNPAWDPSGRTVAVLRVTAGKRFARVLLTPAQGGASSDLGVEGVLATGSLAWSPDGRKLAFTRLHGPDQGVIYEFSMKDRTLRQVSFPLPGQNRLLPGV